MSGEVFTGGATTSQHVDAEDDDHFNNTTFKLKRTRSLGLLDEFIPEKLKEQDQSNEQQQQHPQPETNKSTPNLNQQLKKGSIQNNTNDNSINKDNQDIISYNSDYSSYSDNNNYPQHNSNQSTSVSSSPSPIASPTTTPTLNLQSPELIPYDDSDLTAEPSRHVDYLSHQWDVSDISKSWRYVISKKRDVANAARLENASWRTWAQRRSNLKTISPEVVNWSKESDVTWLYGPILKNNNRSNSQDGNNDGNDENDDTHPMDDESIASSAVAGDISIARKPRRNVKNKPKPILKKRTVEESIISHSNLFKLELATSIYQKKKEQQKQLHEQQLQQQPPDEYFNFDALSDKLNAQYTNKQSTDNTNVAKLQTLLNSNSSSLSTIKQDENTNSNQLTNKNENPQKTNQLFSKPVPAANRHIRFNEEVQQCIAYDSDSDEYEGGFSDNDDTEDVYDDYHDQINNNLLRSHLYEGDNEGNDNNEEEEDDDDDEEEEEEDEEGGFFLKVKSMSNIPLKMGNHQSQQSQSLKDLNSSDNESISSNKSFSSIKLLPPTSLNYGSDEDSSDEDNPYTSSLSHNVNNDISRGYDYYYDYNTVYTCDPNHSLYQTPDVVDLPENLNLGSNFDYDTLENTIEHNENFEDNNYKNSPIISPNIDQNSSTSKQSPFQFNDSESESDDEQEEGLSISSTNSNHKPGSIPKQTTSSNTLSQQFSGGISKELSAQDKSLSKTFLNTNTNNKSSVSPPQTTSENVFSSSPQSESTQSIPPKPKGNTFLFDEDSDSDED
ncbi:REG1 [Candida jiufengensis]|uniref:REG1 n=1 Tax=Candida jiufengensis TaxID=497108 RepID=UPI002224C2F5|nr:REG1 [Candida jiufengensis]KAI5952002.1 REG1 [Candida jiufengensis]